MDKDKIEYEELLEMRTKIESPEFQKFIMKPLYEELDKLKGAYDCKTLTELATLKGKKAGLEWFIDRLKQINVDFENKKTDIETSL